MDEEDYDDDEKESPASTEQQPQQHPQQHPIPPGEEFPAAASSLPPKRNLDRPPENPAATPTEAAAAAAAESSPIKKKRGRPRKNQATSAHQQRAAPVHDYSDTPFGKQGAYMLTNFGDGPQPLPAAVNAALSGCRLLLQAAIRDARALRREHQSQFKVATSVATATKMRKGKRPTAEEMAAPGAGPNAEMLFRATAAHSAKTGRKRNFDPLSYSPTCGFDVQEVEALFPEQMNAYRRWNDMESATRQDKIAGAAGNSAGAEADDDADGEQKPAAAGGEEAVKDGDGNNSEGDPSKDQQTLGTHFAQRLSQFDARTDRMKKDWYVNVFSDIRTGSFLPRRLAGGKEKSSDRDWETRQGGRKRGRQKDGTWGHMTAVTVRFLHWVGFEPGSELPPPNEDTASALAFLGHDFLGRIVEKAIQLKHPESDIMELNKGEQLTDDDIERAMQHPEIKPAALTGTTATSDRATPVMPQLYFGPGFEDRLEMELEEMLGTTVISDRERTIRREEDELFTRLATTQPAVDGIVNMLEKTPPTEIQSKSDASKEADKNINGKEG